MEIEELFKKIVDGKILEYTHTNVELKRQLEGSYGKKICGLANSQLDSISFLIVGVNDDGSLAGHSLKTAEKIFTKLTQQIHQDLNPITAIQKIEVKEISSVHIVYVQISNPGAVVRWKNEAYFTVGSVLRKMEIHEIVGLAHSLPGLNDYSGQQANYEIYSTECVQKFKGNLADKGRSIEGGVLASVGIRQKKAGEILFGNHSFRVAKYKYREKPELNESFQPIYRLLDKDFVQEIVDWLKENCDTNSSMSELSIKEALANAAAHAAYSEKSGEIIVEVFPDRLQISNLCIPGAKAFANKWFSSSHNTINRTLAEALRCAGLIDELGLGKKLIYREAILNGNRPPIVEIEQAGVFSRWRITIFGGSSNPRHVKLYKKCKENFGGSDLLATVACALVFWENQQASDFTGYLDEQSKEVFEEVVASRFSPVLLDIKSKKIYLRRWARVLIDEGKESKKFNDREEEDLLMFLSKMTHDYHAGILTPKLLRELAFMSNSPSDLSLSSTMMKKWTKSNIINKISKGKYKFRRRIHLKNQDKGAKLKELLEILSEMSRSR